MRRGESIVVTDRGESVEELAPACGEKLSLKQRLEKLEASGELRPPRGRRRRAAVVPTRVRGGPVSATVLADRG